MRIKRKIDMDVILQVLRQEAMVSLEDAIGIPAPEESLDPNEVIESEIFWQLKPGSERICVFLRSDGLTYNTIGKIMGLSEGQVKNIMYTIRKRVTKPV